MESKGSFHSSPEKVLEASTQHKSKEKTSSKLGRRPSQLGCHQMFFILFLFFYMFFLFVGDRFFLFAV